jgi:hypothetical protein
MEKINKIIGPIRILSYRHASNNCLQILYMLEITEIREFRITSGNVFLSDYASPITSDVP